MTGTFLGRTLNVNTMTYSFQDGSSHVPVEMRQELVEAMEQRVQFTDGTWSGNGLFVLGTLFSWKRRIGLE